MLINMNQYTLKMVKLLTLYVIYNFVVVILCDHWSRRAELIRKENELMVGSDIEIQGAEECVNKTIMTLKLHELDRGLDYPNEYYPSTNFLEAVKNIEASEVYSFIKDIPKGAALHIHDLAMASPEYLYELTFTENLYVCMTKKGRLLLNFFLFHVDNRCDWKLLEDVRGSDAFENMLRSQLSMDTPSYKKQLSNKMAWTELLGAYATIEGLITYRPIYTTYLREVLSKMYEDNVMYVELRTTLLPVYDLDGNNYGPSDVATLLKETLADFRCIHNDFMGGKIIYAPSRMIDQSWMDYYVKIVDQLNVEHSDFVAGFDLTGQEDLSYPLSRFISSFKEMKSKVNFFFSAGETNWMGAKGDLNLFDAVLLKPTRIGHAFTLFGHPELLKIVKKNDIAIELCPISNQMMMLVGDLRNHPGKYLIAHGYPIVVSSDNPGFWGARTLSHDWYMVFMAMADRKADLRLLMQLAINSIKYSTIDDKEAALDLWRKKWDIYMKDMKQWCKDHEKDNKKESSTESMQIPKITKQKYNSGSWLDGDTHDPTEKIWDITTRPRHRPTPTILPEISEQSTSTISTTSTTLTPYTETSASSMSSASTLTIALSESLIAGSSITTEKGITDTILLSEPITEQTEQTEILTTRTVGGEETNDEEKFSTTQMASTDATSGGITEDKNETGTFNLDITTATIKNDLRTSTQVTELYLSTKDLEKLTTSAIDMTKTTISETDIAEALTDTSTEALTDASTEAVTESTDMATSTIAVTTDRTDITDTNSVTEYSDYDDTSDLLESTIGVALTNDCIEYVDDEEQLDNNASEIKEGETKKTSEYLSSSVTNSTTTAGVNSVSNVANVAVGASITADSSGTASVGPSDDSEDADIPVKAATINVATESSITGKSLTSATGADTPGQDISATGEGSNVGDDTVTQDQNGQNTKEPDQSTVATYADTAGESQNATAINHDTAAKGQNTTAGQNSAAEDQNSAAEGQDSATEGQSSASEGQNSTDASQNSTTASPAT